MDPLSHIPKDIVNTFILPILLREIEGVNADRPNAENLHIVCGFVGLREVCKEWKEAVEGMVEYNAVRLTIWDAGQVGITVYTADPIDIFFRDMYLWNLNMFTTTQRLVVPVEEYQLTMLMKELSIMDLRAIRDTLNCGYIQRALLPSHAWFWETTQMWTSPIER
jgi:hypothetical protein